MCGIAGARDTESAASAVAAMLEAIRHRGPDDGGQWAGAGWCVGMRRLAIMDPGHARQPMLTADGRWALVFNGEIYNFRRLRAELDLVDMISPEHDHPALRRDGERWCRDAGLSEVVIEHQSKGWQLTVRGRKPS